MNMKRTILLALLAAATASASLAEKQTPPAPGPPKGFSVPAPKTYRLGNGLAVTLVQYGTVPKVTVRLAVRAGNVDEGADQVWLADLTGDMLSEGTLTRSASQIAEDAAKMGGSLDITVGENVTRIGGDVLSEFGPEMIALVADVARHPKLPESELERRKTDRLRDLSIARSQPQALAQEKFRAVLYGDHPYGRLFPTEAMLKAYTIGEVRHFYEKNFDAARSHVYVAGRFDGPAMEAAIRKAFGDWKHGEPSKPPAPKPKSERAIYIIDRPGAVQSTINLGLPVIDPSNPDWDALYLTNVLLGGSFASRITSNIREQKGYTYSPYGQLSNRYHDAYWVEIADVTTNVTGPSIHEILGEIERLQAAPPSPKELEAFQNYRAGTFVLQNSSRAGIIGQLEFVDLQGLPGDYLNGYVKRIYAVTPVEVQEMAKKYIRADRATIVIAGDRHAIEDQVKEYGPIR
jgi:zinc protease